MSVSARERRAGQGRAGFTLLEVLIVMALIAVFTGLFVMNFDTMLRQTEAEAVETTFWAAVREARTRALLERRPQTLRFDEKAVEFVLEEAGRERVRSFRIPQEQWTPGAKLEVRFQKRVPPSQYTLVQGELVDVREVPAVDFFPDGTCTPFSLAYEVGENKETLEVDPWTGAQLIKGAPGILDGACVERETTIRKTARVGVSSERLSPPGPTPRARIFRPTRRAAAPCAWGGVGRAGTSPWACDRPARLARRASSRRRRPVENFRSPLEPKESDARG